MNVFKRIRWFFTSRIYPSSDIIGYLVGSFIDEGKLIKENEFYAFIEYKNNIYKVWIENYPYAWLSKCESVSKENYELRYPIWGTIWNRTVPPKKIAMKFEDWLYKERKRLFDEQNSIKETDNTHQTTLKETAMSNETSCEFKTFDHVLVRDHRSSEWLPDIFVRYNPVDEDGNETAYPYETIGSKYKYCISYDESLAFTTGADSTDFKKGDTVEFIYLREGKWFRGVITDISTKEIKGDNFIYRVDFTDSDGDKDWIWCKLDQLREACANVDDDDNVEEENEEEKKEHKFQVDQKVWYKGEYSDDKWVMATVQAIDSDDDELPYRVELFTNEETWWVKESELKSIDDYPF